MLHGITVKLYQNIEIGVDDFGVPMYTTESVDVDNVIVEPTSADAIVQETQLYGKHSAYTLHVPKGDNHNWKDAIVEVYGEKYRSFGDIPIYQSELVPLDWNKKVKVERYE